jgi:hypothetical protein
MPQLEGADELCVVAVLSKPVEPVDTVAGGVVGPDVAACAEATIPVSVESAVPQALSSCPDAAPSPKSDAARPSASRRDSLLTLSSCIAIPASSFFDNLQADGRPNILAP